MVQCGAHGGHPDVDLVSFTGGLETGRRLMAAAAGTVKKVALKLEYRETKHIWRNTRPTPQGWFD
ncbi:hypothetical protein GCM10011428_18930 [Streptomyces violaceus]